MALGSGRLSRPRPLRLVRRLDHRARRHGRPRRIRGRPARRTVRTIRHTAARHARDRRHRSRAPDPRELSLLEVDLRLDPFDTPWPEIRDAVRAAVDGGFAGIWTPDHLDGRVFGGSQVLECWTTLTAIAASTFDVKVGPLVLNVANRDPGVLAAMAATLQDISGGRLLLGLHAGVGASASFRREQEAIGRTVPSDPVRRAQVEACVEEMRRLWD